MASSVILGTARTPVGKMGGTLASVDATDLGGTAIGAALDRSGVGAEQIQQVVFGQVLQADRTQVAFDRHDHLFAEACCIRIHLLRTRKRDARNLVFRTVKPDISKLCSHCTAPWFCA